MKLLLFMSIILISNAGYAKIFQDIEKNEAYANIMGLYVENLEKEAVDTTLTGEEKFNLKKEIQIAKKEIEKTEVRSSRMFLTLDFDLMCESLYSKESLNLETMRNASINLKKRQSRKSSHRYNNHRRNKLRLIKAESLNETISEIQKIYCSN